MKVDMKKKVKIHLKLKPILVLSFFLLSLGCFIYYLIKLPIKTIYIEGTVYLKDKEIIELLDIKDYPKLFKYTTKSLEKKLETLEMVTDVKIKKYLNGTIKIKIQEARPLFYNRSDYCYVLSNGQTTNNYDFSGIPFLVNYVPNQIMERFIKELERVSNENLMLISEIEYSPSRSDEVVIDDTRFLLRMNDGNEVYINLINIDRLNTYPLIYSLFDEKGILELDSDNERVVFRSYKSIEENRRE